MQGELQAISDARQYRDEEKSMKFSKDNVRHVRSLIIFTVLLFLGIQRFDVILLILNYVWELLFPFVLGLCIAYILSIPMRFVERILFSEKKKVLRPFVKKIKRPISLFITIILVLSVIGIVMFIVVPELISTGETLYNTIPDAMNDIQVEIKLLIDKYPFLKEHVEFKFDWNSLTNTIVDFIQNDLINTLSSTMQVARKFVGTLIDILIALFFSIYVLLQKEQLSRQVKAVLSAFLKESTKAAVVRIARLADSTFASFFSGQCIEAVILGTLFVIAMTIFGFPYAVLVGVLIAFTALVPLFGPLIGCAISAFLIFTTNPVQAFWFIVLFFALQLLEENLIYPHVVGNAVGLPPIWVLAAVTIGGALFGIVGMLFFIPLTSVLYVLFREWVHARNSEKEKLEQAQAEIAESDGTKSVEASKIIPESEKEILPLSKPEKKSISGSGRKQNKK